MQEKDLKQKKLIKVLLIGLVLAQRKVYKFMKHMNSNKYLFNLIFISILLLLITLILLMPTISINAFLQGIIIWSTKVMPALLPFFILTKILYQERM